MNLEQGTMEPTIDRTKKARILVVEDETLISEWVAEYLSEQGFAVQTAANAADALRQLAAAPIEVLFTDINLPGGMDGAALACRARELLPQLAVIYGSARLGMLEPRSRVPGSVALAKPYTASLVGQGVAAALRTIACAPA